VFAARFLTLPIPFDHGRKLHVRVAVDVFFDVPHGASLAAINKRPAGSLWVKPSTDDCEDGIWMMFRLLLANNAKGRMGGRGR